MDSLAWSNDGRLMAAVARNAEDKVSLHIWRDGVEQRSLPLPSGLYQALFAPRGTLLALVDRSDRMNGIQLVDAADGSAKRELETGWPISAVTFAPDGTRLAASPIGPETGIWLWDTRSWRRERIALGTQLGTYQQSLDFLPGGLLAITYAGANVGLWDTRTWQLRRRLSARDGLSSDVMGGPAAVTSDGRWLALAYTPLPPVPTFLPYPWRIRVWDLRSGATAGELHPARDMEMLAFRPGSAVLAAQFVGDEGALQLFEPGSWKQQQSFSWTGGLDTLAFSPAGDLAFAGPAAGKTCAVEIRPVPAR